MVEIHALFAVQALGVVPAHAVPVNLASQKNSKEQSKRATDGQTFSTANGRYKPLFILILISSSPQ